MSAKRHVRKGFHSITPCLRAEGAIRLIRFLEEAFGATEVDERMEAEDGTLLYAGVEIEGSRLEISEAREDWGAMVCALHLYLPDTDAAYRRALEAGACSLYEPAVMPYGERSAGVLDPAGNHWYLATYTGEEE